MKRPFKHFLLWLLIALLPLQGVAALLQHGWTAPVPLLAAQAGGMHHAAMAMAAHEACIDAPVAGGDTGHHASHKQGCSASAACCTGAAVPPGFTALKLPADTAEVYLVSVITPHAGPIPDGLERPPRRSAI